MLFSAIIKEQQMREMCNKSLFEEDDTRRSGETGVLGKKKNTGEGG